MHPCRSRVSFRRSREPFYPLYSTDGAKDKRSAGGSDARAPREDVEGLEWLQREMQNSPRMGKLPDLESLVCLVYHED